jgi:outer membrane protein OmpA-like peptidoglycan-associated protein
MNSARLAVRGETLVAFAGRCIPGGGVAPPSNTAGILSRRAWPAGRLARLGATPDFRHGLLASLVAVLIVTLAAGAVSGCVPKRIRTPGRSAPDLVVLLPDPGDGTVGRVVVSNSSGAATLATARNSVSVSSNQPPGPVTVMTEADVTRIFGDALSALPLAAQPFTLFFRFESDELTDDSRALLAQILGAVKGRPFPDVVVIGHTDTMGTRASNIELGLKRAAAIRGSLIDAGIDASTIEVTSNGEADLLIGTADEVLEPRNRRVEITVR